MQKSGFFNAKLTNGIYDKKYNANDYSDNLAVIIGNGVLRSDNDDLKVTANGMNVSVGIGRGWINGHYYKNDAVHTFAPIQPPTGGSRIDRVVLRLDNSIDVRDVHLDYIQGTPDNNPTPPAITRNNTIYELVLADILVQSNATSVVVTDTRADSSVCGWIYSTSGDGSFFQTLDNDFNEWFSSVRDEVASVTLFKKYTWKTTLTATASVAQFNIPQYDAETCFIEVYVNGVYETDYTLNNNIITFNGTLIGGTEVLVNCYKSIDGTGIQSVSDEITQLQNQVSAMNGYGKFAYICTGVNDNISLSQIAQAIYHKSYNEADVNEAARKFLSAIGGNTYLASLSDDAQIGIDVVGKLGATTPFLGTGASGNEYKWFSLGYESKRDIRLIFDFAKCDKVNIVCSANSTNSIIYGADLNIKNLNIKASSSATSCNIQIINSANNLGRIYLENCKMECRSSGSVLIATHGTFTNCYGFVLSEAGTPYCFTPKMVGLVRVNSGEYYAYRNASSGQGAYVIRIASSDSDAVFIGDNMHCPQETLTGYTQDGFASAQGGQIIVNTVVTRLNSTGASYTINNKVNKDKF